MSQKLIASKFRLMGKGIGSHKSISCVSEISHQVKSFSMECATTIKSGDTELLAPWELGSKTENLLVRIFELSIP